MQRRSEVADTPTTRDLLDYKPFARAIGQHISTLGLEQTPLTIGVFGEWGSGKTSFLQMVDLALGEQQLRPVWFHAWKYEQEDNLWSALIQTIIGRGTIHQAWYRRWWAKLRIRLRTTRLLAGTLEMGRGIAVLVARLLVIVFCALVIANREELEPILAPLLGGHAGTWTAVAAALVGLVAAKPEALLDLFSARIGVDLEKFRAGRGYRERIAALDEFTEELEEIVAIAGGGRPLVVVIDDLDRCLPEKALQVLEAIKLFLDVPGVVFLLAVDREVIERAVAARYLPKDKEKPAAETSAAIAQAESYLEKLIHLPFALPQLGRPDVVRLVKGICEEQPEVAALGDLFAAGLPPNPRSVKRTLQMFLFVRALRKGKEVGEELLAKMIVIQERCRDLYRELQQEGSLLGDLEQVARGGGAATPQLAALRRERIDQYLARYPLLSALLRQKQGESFVGVDLTPYLTLLRALPEVERRSPQGADQALRDRIAATIFAESPALEQQLPIRLRGPRGEEVTLSAVEPQIDTLTRQSGRILLLGPPGSGKTSLLLMLGRALLRPSDRSEPTRVPLYVRLRQLRPTGDTVMDWLLGGVFGSVQGEGQVATELARLVAAGECCIMLDGLDEVVGTDREFVERRILDLVGAYPANQVIVATRAGSGGYLQSSHFAAWTLLPPNESDAIAYLKDHVGEKAPQLVARVREVFGDSLSPAVLRVVRSGAVGEAVPDAEVLSVAALVDRALMDLASRGLSSDAARLLLERMTSHEGPRPTLPQPALLAIGRGMGLSDVETLAYLRELSVLGLVRSEAEGYTIAHDLIASLVAPRGLQPAVIDVAK